MEDRLSSIPEVPDCAVHEGSEAAKPPGSQALSQLLKVVPLPLTLSRGDPEA